MEIVELTPKLCEQYAPEISEYIYQSYTQAHQYNESFSLEKAKDKCRELREYLAQGRACAFGAIDHTLIGFIWSYRYPFRDDENRTYVSTFHVDERYRNRHIGEQLLRAVERKAVENGCHTVFLHTEARNSGAIHFYERMGYQMERVQMVKKSASGGYNAQFLAVFGDFCNFYRIFRVARNSEAVFRVYGETA